MIARYAVGMGCLLHTLNTRVSGNSFKESEIFCLAWPESRRAAFAELRIFLVIPLALTIVSGAIYGMSILVSLLKNQEFGNHCKWPKTTEPKGRGTLRTGRFQKRVGV